MGLTSRPLIIGGGWAGLAAAVELAHAGHRPLLLEAAPQLGGRARAVEGSGADNGVHLLLGAYREVRRLLALMAVPEGEVFRRRRFHLTVSGPAHLAELRARPLPFPFDLLCALLLARGLPRWALLYSAQRLRAADLEAGETVSDLLHRLRVAPRLRRYLWEPLCLAALNTPASRASAAVFVRVLADAFGSAGSSDLLSPRRHLSACLPDPAERFIVKCGGEVRRATRAAAILVAGGRVSGVRTAQGERLAADHLIVATAPHAAARLLADTPLAAVSGRLAALPYEAVTTVYLRYPPQVRQRSEMVGWVGRLGQWSFDHRSRGEKGLIGVVISGNGPHLALPKGELLRRIAGELARFHPHWPPPRQGWVVRDRRATFRCDPPTAGTRPPQNTPLPGCWLAGDYTATGYPATLEGAVRSGVQCARLVTAAMTTGTGESHD